MDVAVIEDFAAQQGFGKEDSDHGRDPGQGRPLGVGGGPDARGGDPPAHGIGQIPGGYAHRNFSLRAAKALMRKRSSPWRKREMFVSPYVRSW